ncbi:sugar-transfer associated ATP-grasp domain-containing protein [Chenggangzhangella methanolivorans]|uniref:Alpha-L-glutamate ligase-related protein ATP-grasp domain-containing protein n=1 Tax=Chenggangzhangella methanolivorans TaxID=1437009 RepID=A0A9E6UK57_9HYPH|nr:sugar-transfer associated ATP-grasp domain-containing protein [Chenggangzhangella methanolivorans]QZN98861.1 hypothetical protein K6K41_18310 [Chenggangzhangella methanolivorans]
MIAPRTSVAGQFGPFLLAFGLALPLLALSGRVAPLGPESGFEIGNDFVALLGLSFAGIQLVAHRRSASLRAAWGWAALGTLLIAVEDHLEPLVAPVVPKLLEVGLSNVAWILAASLIVLAGRRYAMRRYVMIVMRLGLAITLAAVGLNFALHAFGFDETAHGMAKAEDLAELAATTTFVLGLLLTQIAPMKSYHFAPDQIGLRARRLFYDFGLETRRRYPAPQPILALPVIRHLFILAIIARFMPGSAGAVRDVYGRGVLAQLGDLLRMGFVHGVDAKSYYVHELYRPEPGLFEATITRVETKNGLNRRIQLLRAAQGGPSDMNDKLEFFRVCEEHGVATAPIMATVEDGALVWMASRDDFDRDLFVKDRRGRGGRFTFNFERAGRFLYRADDGAIVNLAEVLQTLRLSSADRRLIIQPKLRNHPLIGSLAEKSLVVFRVMTCLDSRGEPQATHGVLRLLRRFEPGWPKTPDADWGCEIDVETGAFGLMTGDAPETATRWFTDHPATGERLSGRILEGWREISEAALAAHRVFSARVLVGWDIAWTPEGPVILEGNSNPDVSYFQRVSRTPVGRSPLGPLLNVHLGALTAKLLDQTAREQRRPDADRRDAKPGPRSFVAAKLAVDRFFERGIGGRAAGTLADMRFARWRRANPGATYADFYAHRATLRLERGGAHKTLGLRHYRADPLFASVTHETAQFSNRGRRYFRWFEDRALRSDMVCVDYGCGSLRVGQHFIRHLEPGRYIGLDVVDRFFRDGLTLLGPELVAEKRPYLSAIDAASLEFAARRNPDLIYSTAVLQHVPPAELDAYFGAIVGMMGPRAVAVVNFKSADSTVRIGSSAWAHSFPKLLSSLDRVDPKLIVWHEPQPAGDGDDHAQAMLIIARAPDQLAKWSARPD